MDASYQLREVTVAYDERRAIDIDTLDIAGGEITVIVGTNGSGKSTLLHVLAFLTEPSHGTVRLNITDTSTDKATYNTLEAQRRYTTLVTQEPFLFHRTVHGNLHYGVKRHGRGAEAIETALNRVGLEGFANRNAAKLSGGEQQRVAIARAIAIDTPVILFDEPTANVDQQSRPMIEGLMRELANEGKLVVTTTHDIDQAHRIGDEIIALEQGKLVRPPRRNVLSGSIRRSDDRVVLDTGSFEIEVSDSASSTIEISADDILVSRERLKSSARNSLRGTIERIVHEEKTVVLFVDCGETVTARITERSYTEMTLHPGESVYLTFKATSLGK